MLREAAMAVVDMVEEVGNRTQWADGDETDMVICWRDVKPMRDALDASTDAEFNAMTDAIACVKARQEVYRLERNTEMVERLESVIGQLKVMRKEWTCAIVPASA